jgi:hypothetical protein
MKKIKSLNRHKVEDDRQITREHSQTWEKCSYSSRVTWTARTVGFRISVMAMASSAAEPELLPALLLFRVRKIDFHANSTNDWITYV